MDIAAWVPVLDKIGTVAVVLIIGWAIATGRLVTRRELQREQVNGDTWRAATEREHEARVKLDALAERGEERDRTMLRLLESIHEEAQLRRKSDERAER
jgi:hypothetical protein